MAHLELTGVGLVFNPGSAQEITALREVDLKVNEGEFVIIVGSNGSGKSSLMDVLSGTVPCSEGTIHLAGRDITRWPEQRRAALIGRVFQDPFAGTAPALTVMENLALAANRGRSLNLARLLTRDIRAQVPQRLALLRMGLEERPHATVGSLSGGQRQGLTLLMATWRPPELLLLDEPTAALDPQAADRVLRLSDDIVRGGRLTTLMVTHSIAQAVHLGDRLLLLHRGGIELDLSGPEKKRLRADDLYAFFGELRRRDQIDESMVQILAEQYI
jgi:putative ABC transport system ATP-binding protein